MTGKEKATAPVSSVGADGKQSLCNKSNRSIADLPQKGNLQATESCPMESEKMQNKDLLEYFLAQTNFGFYLNARFSYPNIPPKNAHY